MGAAWEGGYAAESGDYYAAFNNDWDPTVDQCISAYYEDYESSTGYNNIHWFGA